MKVGILGDYLRTPLTGIGHYTRSLVHALRSEFPENEYVVLQPDLPDFINIGPPSVREPVPRWGGRMAKLAWWKYAGARKCAARLALDLVHNPGDVRTLARRFERPTRAVLTLHDLTPLLLPATHEWRNVVEFRLLARLAVKHSDVIISDSHSGLVDLKRTIPRSSHKLNKVIPLGVGENFFVGRVPRPVQLEPLLPKRYFLCVGSIEPRKNLITAIRALALYRASGGEAHIVLAGGKGWKNTPVYELVEALELRDYVVELGYVSDDHLPSLYANALAFVYPSFYEGFGLPLLEAMAAGCPVITSNRSSIPEVVGDVAITSPPEDFAQVADAMMMLDSDPGERQRRSAAGRARASEFSWLRVARETQQVYDELMSSRYD